MGALSSFSPITKVGGVLLRLAGGSDYEFLIVQPQPKQLGFYTPWGFVRGTRQYRETSTGRWIDAPRDGGAQPEGVEWEPLIRTLALESHQEAGLSPAMLVQNRVYDIGPRTFISSSQREAALYPIHWFAAVLDARTQALLPHTGPGKPPNFLEDALQTAWVTLARIKELAAVDYADTLQDRMSPSYVAIAEEAVAGIKEKRFASVVLE